MEAPDGTSAEQQQQDQEEQEVRQEQKKQIGNLLSGGAKPDHVSDEDAPLDQDIEDEDVDEEDEEVELEDDEDLEDEEEVIDEDEDEEPEEDEDEEEESAEEEEEEVSELEQYKKQVAELRNQITELSKDAGGKSIELPSGEEEGEEEEVDTSQQVEYVGDDETFDEITTDRKSFNKFLNDFATRIEERTLRKSVDAATQRSTATMTLQQRVADFYKQHQDLKPHQEFVGYQVNKILAEKPELANDMDGLLDEAAKRSRAALAMSNKAQKSEKKRRKAQSKKRKPAFAGKQKGQRAHKKEDDLNDQQKQIAELIGLGG